MELRGINRRLPIEATANLIERLNDGIDKCEPDQCWNWLKGFRNGYGAIKHQGRVLSSHRVAYVVANGEPADGTIITHTCDNRACCNPAHLTAGTALSNVHDLHERGRANVNRGESRPNAKLNETAVANIWAKKRVGMGPTQIAEELGLTLNQVKSVLRGKNWVHLIPEWAKK